MSICSFFGSNIYYENHIKDKIFSLCKKLNIENNLNEFHLFLNGEFESCSYCAVKRIKEEHNEIKIKLVLTDSKELYTYNLEFYKEMYDEIIVPISILDADNSHSKTENIKKHIIGNCNYLIYFDNKKDRTLSDVICSVKKFKKIECFNINSFHVQNKI